jgi:hypothetical protein
MGQGARLSDRQRIMRSLGRALSLYLLLLLGACAGVIAGIPPKMETITTVGIVSAFGDKFHVQKYGLTVFGNDLKEFPIDSWGIDDHVAGQVRALLSKRFDVRPVTYRRADVAAPKDIWGGIGATIRAQVSPQGLDAYIVLTSAESQYASTNQSLNGLGIVEHGGGAGIFPKHYFLFALYYVSVIDGNQFSPLGLSVASLPEAPSYLMAVIHGPNREVDQSLWPASLDAASNQRLKGGVIELIDKSLPNTLQQMQLTD